MTGWLLGIVYGPRIDASVRCHVLISVCHFLSYGVVEAGNFEGGGSGRGARLCPQGQSQEARVLVRLPKTLHRLDRALVAAAGLRHSRGPMVLVAPTLYDPVLAHRQGSLQSQMSWPSRTSSSAA
jgi:hypothetical protein